MKGTALGGKQRALLIVIFIPNVDRDAKPIDQPTCREMGRSTNQGEVGLVIDNVYHAVRP